VEIAARREEAERQEVERLGDAQEATRQLVEEAERRAADAEQRAADAVQRAEQARRDAEEDAKKELADAHRKAELIIAQAKDDGKQALADIDADADKRRGALKRELDELTRQKNEVDAQLAKMRQVFALGALGDVVG
jgi:vacuolar-type H+-ATPase subunit H